MQIRSRRDTYLALVGIAIGSMITGLVLPFALGDQVPDAALLTDAPGEVAAPGGTDEGEAVVASGDLATSETAARAVDDTGGPASPSGGADDPAPEAGSADGEAPAPGSSAGLRATDVGVTASTIKLGVVLLDLSTARSVGLAPENYTLEDQRRAYDVFVGRVNQAGGINGRKVQVVYAVADPFEPSTAEAACLRLTRDEKSFAVLSVAGFRGTASLCITRDNRTPLIAQGHHPTEYFRASAGLLITDQATSERTAQSFVDTLDRLGPLKSKTIGLVTNRDAANGEKQGGDAVAAALKASGYEVAHRADLSEDLPTGAGQIPVEVQQMRAAGVDAVLLATNFLYSTQFAQAADGQGWRPAWFAGEIGDMTTDVLTRNMPASYDGAIAVTTSRHTHDARAGRPEAPIDRDCREYFNAKAGTRHPYGGENGPALPACAGVGVFRAAATGAGPDLTRASFSSAAPRLGAFAWPGMLGGSLGSGKYDYADQTRPLRWRADCRCYHIAG